MPTLLDKTTTCAKEFVYRLHHMDRDADGSRLIGYGPGYRLPYPPGCVGAEFVPPSIIELLHRPYETDVPLLARPLMGFTPPDILLGDAHYQAKVGLGGIILSPYPFLFYPFKVGP